MWGSVKCVKCADMGYIRCYSPESMRMAIEAVKGTRRSVSVSFCDVPCACDEGDVKSFQTHQLLRKMYKNKDCKPPIRADDLRVIHVPREAKVDHVAILMEWAREYVKAEDTARAKREAPFQIFEDFNQGAEYERVD